MLAVIFASPTKIDCNKIVVIKKSLTFTNLLSDIIRNGDGLEVDTVDTQSRIGNYRLFGVCIARARNRRRNIRRLDLVGAVRHRFTQSKIGLVVAASL